MADNTTLNTGTGGDVIATDDIAGVKHQRVKLEIGADGAASDVHSGNPLPVTGTVAVSGSVAATLSEPISVDDNGASLTVDTPQLPAALVGGRLDVNIGAGSVSISGTVDTELPAASALADATANPTVPAVGAFLMGWNQQNANWDRYRLATMLDDSSFSAGASYLTPVGGFHLAARDTVNNGETGAFAMTASRALYSTLETPNGDSALDDTLDTVRVSQATAANLNAQVQGTAAADAAVSGNPLYMGARASTAAPTPVSADGDAVGLRATRGGELMVALTDLAGDSVADESNNAIRVNVVAGGGSGGTSMADDAAFTPASTQVTPVAGMYRSTRDLVDDNDAGALAMTQRRALYATLETPLGDALVDDTNDHLKIGGAVAHDSANAGNVNPLLMGARAANSPLSAVSADGDAVMLRADRLGQLCTRLVDAAGDSMADEANDALRVNIVAGAAAGGTSQTDGAAFTVDTTPFTPVGGTYKSTRDALSDNTAGAIALTVRRAVYTTLETPEGDSMVDEANDALRVSVVSSVTGGLAGGGDTITADEDAVTIALTDGRTTAGLHISGTWTATLQFEGSIDDSVWFALPVRPAGGGAVVTSTAANGQWFADGAGCSSIRVRASDFTSGTATVEHLRHVSPRVTDSVALTGSLPSGTNNIGDVDVLSLPALPAGTNNIGDVDVLTLPGVTGAAAHDSAVSGNPLLNGFEARTTAPTAVSNGDAVRGQSDSLGKQITLMGAPHELDVQGDAVFTNTTAADLIAAQGAGIKIVVTSILVVNGHATVGTKVEIRDGTTVLMQGFAAPLGGGWSKDNPKGILKSSANAAITGRCVTTGADVDIFVSGYTITNG